MLRIFLASTLLLSACASRQLGRPAEMLSSSVRVDLEVSSEVIQEFSDKYNVLVQVNLESKDGQWIRVDSAELDLSNPDEVVQNIIIGKDLSAWLQAKTEEKKIRDQNEDMASLGILSAGALLIGIGSKQNNKATTATGAIAATGASGYLLTAQARRTKDAAQQAQWVPDTHLYSPFTVPSMSLVKRWVLINAPSGRVNRSAVLKLKTVEGELLTYNLKLAE